MYSFRWPLRHGVHAPSSGGTGTGDWKTDGQHYRRCQGVHLPLPAAVRGTTEGECGLMSKHVHHQLAHCNPLFHFLNVLVPTGFVLVGQKNNTNFIMTSKAPIAGLPIQGRHTQSFIVILVIFFGQLKGSLKELNKFHIYEAAKITHTASDVAEYIELFNHQ